MSEDAFKAGQVVDDRFVLRRKLGTGGFGVVWLATDQRNAETEVALKILTSRARRNHRIVERFAREASLLQQLDHPSIAKAFSFRIEEERSFVALEYVDGAPLRSELERRAKSGSPFQNSEILQLIEELSAAVDYAHSLNVVHRDLKPSNVMIIRRDGALKVKVLDFGIAKFLDDSEADSTTVGRFLGSRFYMSPEQARGEAVDRRTDIFSLGTMLFELLTLRMTWFWDTNDQPARRSTPTRSKHNDHLAVMTRITVGVRPRASAYREDLPQAVDAVIARAMAIAPDERFQSAGELAAALREALLAAPMTSVEAMPEQKQHTNPDDALPPVEPSEISEGSWGDRTSAEDTVSAAPVRPIRRPSLRRKRRRKGLVPVAIALAALFAVPAALSLRAKQEVETPPPKIESFAEPAIIVREGLTDEHVEPLPVDRARTSPARRPARPKVEREAAKSDEEVAAAPEQDPLDVLLAHVKDDPNNAHAIQELKDGILQRASRLPPGNLRATIERRVTASTFVFDVPALEQCVKELRGHRHAPSQ